MNSEVNTLEPEAEAVEIDEFDGEDMEDTEVLLDTEPTVELDDSTVEKNLEALIADIDELDTVMLARQKEIRRRLEDLAEEKSFEDTYALEFDD